MARSAQKRKAARSAPSANAGSGADRPGAAGEVESGPIDGDPTDSDPIDSSQAVVRTLAGPSRHEIDKIKGSRFFATLEPVRSREEANAVLDALRAEFRDATHHCYAWRLGRDPEAMRYSDDGEPSGTAGRPILAEIDGRGLSDLVVVVTRYYGGTKLGTGGLLRAYSSCAAEALDRATWLERPVVERLVLRFSYGLTGPIRGVLAAYELEGVDAEYGAEVRMELAVPIARVRAVRRALVDATNGQVRFEREPEES